MFSRSYLTLLLGATLTSTAAGATELSDWYAGAQAGWSKHQHIGPATDAAKETVAVGALVGHQFTSHFALETAYQYLGVANFTPEQKTRFVQLGLLGRAGYQLTDSLYPYMKVGASAWVGNVSGAENARGISPVIGTGIAYKLSKQADLVLDYQFTADMADNVNYPHHSDNHAVTVGFNWRFAKDTPAKPVVVAPVVKEEPVVVAPVEKPAPVTKPEVVVLSGENAGTMFANNSAKLQDTSALEPIVAAMKKHPEYQATILGYTDSLGALEYNIKLSEQRALSTAYFLISRGIEAERISGKGMGPANPVADNTTAAGRAANRRVEISLDAK